MEKLNKKEKMQFDVLTDFALQLYDINIDDENHTDDQLKIIKKLKENIKKIVINQREK